VPPSTTELQFAPVQVLVVGSWIGPAKAWGTPTIKRRAKAEETGVKRIRDSLASEAWLNS
jgi:hypothetical protein